MEATEIALFTRRARVLSRKPAEWCVFRDRLSWALLRQRVGKVKLEEHHYIPFVLRDSRRYERLLPRLTLTGALTSIKNDLTSTLKNSR